MSKSAMLEKISRLETPPMRVLLLCQMTKSRTQTSTKRILKKEKTGVEREVLLISS
jgi:hypothetical protein